MRHFRWLIVSFLMVLIVLGGDTHLWAINQETLVNISDRDRFINLTADLEGLALIPEINGTEEFASFELWAESFTGLYLVNLETLELIDVRQRFFNNSGNVSNAKFGDANNLFLLWEVDDVYTAYMLDLEKFEVELFALPGETNVGANSVIHQNGDYVAFVQDETTKISLYNVETRDHKVLNGSEYGYFRFFGEISFLKNPFGEPFLLLDGSDTSRLWLEGRPAIYNPITDQLSVVSTINEGFLPPRPFLPSASPFEEGVYYLTGESSIRGATDAIDLDVFRAEYNFETNTVRHFNLSKFWGSPYPDELAPQAVKIGERVDVLSLCGELPVEAFPDEDSALCLNINEVVVHPGIDSQNGQTSFGIFSSTQDGGLILIEYAQSGRDVIDMILLKPENLGATVIGQPEPSQDSDGDGVPDDDDLCPDFPGSAAADGC